MKRRVGVLISGRGSNMEALARAAGAASFPAEIAVVIADRASAAGLAIARGLGLPTDTIPGRRHHGDRAAHEAAIDAALRSAGCDIVCLAGYMRVLTPFLIDRWSGRMLNIHPSLLPAFPGLDTHERALAAGVRLHGCTVHLVTERLDEGPILAQAAVPVLADDTPESLAARVLVQEHRLYPAALAAFITGCQARADPAASLSNPPAPFRLASAPESQ